MASEQLQELVEALPAEGEAFDTTARRIWLIAVNQVLDCAYGEHAGEHRDLHPSTANVTALGPRSTR